MLVRHFMTAQVITFGHDITCGEALRLMHKHRIRRAPVVRAERLVGMLSERDLLRVLPGTIRQIDTRAGADAEQTPIAMVMNATPLTLDPEAHIEDAARAMMTNRIGGMPVVADGVIVGMLTESDLFRAFVQIANSSGLLRISLSRTKVREHAPDPVMLALRLGFRVRGFLRHEKPGSEEFAVLRVQGGDKKRLLTMLEHSGYKIVEVVDRRLPEEQQPAA